MSKKRVTFPYDGHRELTVELDAANLGPVLSPADVVPAGSDDGLIEAALDAPIGSLPLEQRLHPGQRVLILSDDNTRPTPVHRILPRVLDRLARAGIPEADIRLMIASGTHRPMTPAEVAAKLGPGMLTRIAVGFHACHDRSQLVAMGCSADGVEVWLNRAVAEADFVLGIGNVVPHPHAGWAGGAKILYPGVAGAETVAAFHRVGAADPVNHMGRDDAPARASLESLADTAGLHFVINTVLTRDHRLFKVFAGGHREAQAAAQSAARSVYGIPASDRFDIVVANSYPAYLEFWQAAKGFFAAEPIVKPGGTIILVTPCPEGIGVTHPLQVQYLSMALPELVRAIDAGEVTDPIAAAVCAKVAHIKTRAKAVVVSPGLRDQDVRAMGMEPISGLEAALAAKLAAYGSGARVAFITHGGESFAFIR